MELSDSDKLKILWKHVMYGVQQTKPERFPFEEYVPVSKGIHADDIYYESAKIPVPAASYPNISQYMNPANLYPEDASGRVWFCLKDKTKKWSTTNVFGDWINWEFDPSYEVRLFSDKYLTNRILPNTLGYEWVFDYKFGTLKFINAVPAGIPGLTGLYLVGFRYIGSKAPVLPAIPVQRYHYDYPTRVMKAGEKEEFTLTTGYAAVLLGLTVTGAGGTDPSCLVEAHSTPARNDTNPYAFKAVPSHTSDDGSWVSYGSTYYGIPNVTIANMEIPPTTNSYWRITKAGGTGSITMSISIQSLI